MPNCLLFYTLLEMAEPNSFTIEITRQHYDLAGRLKTDSIEIGQVFEMDNPNPLVKLELPIGVEGIVKIVQLIQTQKNKNAPA